MSADMQSQVNEEALLNVLMYLDPHDVAQNGDSMKSIIQELGVIYGDGASYGNFHKDHEVWDEDEFNARKRQYQILVNAVNQNPHLSNLTIDNISQFMKNPSYEEGGLAAATFKDGENHVYVVYRGTGLGEWLDNGTGLGGTVNDTEQQNEALEYFDRVVEANRWNDGKHFIDITGHSKGGNKAQFVTMTSKYSNLIRSCYSFDGQGMSPESIEWMKETLGEIEFNRRREKLYSISADNDFVNILGTRLVPKEHIFFLENQLGWGKTLHFPDAYLKDDGTLTPFTEQGEISKFLESESDMVMSLPPPIRNVVTEGLISLMQLSKGVDPVNGEKISWAEILGAIPIFLDTIPGAVLDYLGKKFGINLEWLGTVLTGFNVIFNLPTYIAWYGIGLAIDLVIGAVKGCIEVLKGMANIAKEITSKIVGFFEGAINGLKNFFNNIFNSGLKYAAEHPVIKIDTYKLRNYAQQLQSLNRRLSNLNSRLDSITSKNSSLLDNIVDTVSDIVNDVVDLFTGNTRNLDRVVSYLMDTANDFEVVERKIMNNL